MDTRVDVLIERSMSHAKKIEAMEDTIAKLGTSAQALLVATTTLAGEIQSIKTGVSILIKLLYASVGLIFAAVSKEALARLLK